MNSNEKRGATLGIAALLLLSGAGVGALMTYDRLEQNKKDLEVQVAQLTKKQKESEVMQRVNAQMEEIANEERRISDEQRDAAEEQTRVAEQERINAEQQRQQAERERQNALAAEHTALEASEVAQKQRQIAEHQRAEAEYSKRVADTLSYLTLARSLGTSAINQYRAGNTELAELLSYTATLFTSRYRGDIYAPTVYQSLAMTSQNKSVWNKHKGSVTDIAFYDEKSGDFVSCSTYGEVFRHHQEGNNLQTETLVRDSRYDFRDVFIDRKRNIVYALSRTSHLVVIKGIEVQRVIEVNIPKLNRLEQTEKDMLLFGEQGMALLNPDNQTIIKEKTLPYKIVTICRKANTAVLFDNKGNQHLVKSFDNIKTNRVPVNGQVTAYAESKNNHIEAYGMSDGTIHFFNAQGKSTRLLGHRSQVSKLKINGFHIYSSSYDGTMNLWLANMDRMEPMPLFTTNGWIINFTYDPTKTYIWTGDQKGNLTQALISVPVMIERLKNKLKRNLTREEWKYYVGNNVPYETIIAGKGVGK